MGFSIGKVGRSMRKTRNAVLGWATWNVGKRVVKRKAKAVVPGAGGGGSRRKKPAALAALATLGGAVFFWRRKSDGESPTGAP
jgi:hypothetical protein